MSYEPIRNKYCSHDCYIQDRQKTDWSNLLEMKKAMNNTQIGKKLNVSETSVRKRLKQMCESTPPV